MRRLFLIACLALPMCLPARAAQEEDMAKYRSDIDEGINLLRMGSPDETSRAIARFTSARKIQPEGAEAYYWIALAYSDLHNYLRAADNAKNATIYDDTLAEAWSLWGQVLLYQKDYNEALNKLETAARLDPEDPVTQFNLGRVYYHGFKDPDSALAKFRIAWQKGMNLRRNNPAMIAMTVNSRLYMGCCEYDRGLKNDNPANFEMAVNAFQDVIREQPNNYDALLRLSLALRKINRSAEAATILNNLLRHFEQTGENIDAKLLAEINLQLADLYLKDPVARAQDNNIVFVPYYLRNFLALIGDSNHPAAEAARDYIAQTERAARGM